MYGIAIILVHEVIVELDVLGAFGTAIDCLQVLMCSVSVIQCNCVTVFKLQYGNLLC